MTTLVLTRGLPGSGKTTQAMDWVRDAPGGQPRARVNRDDLRSSLFGGEGVLPWAQEQAITTVQQATVRALLAAGTDVVVDDLNLRAKYAKAWADIAAQLGADLEVWDLTAVPLDECIRRDNAREEDGGRHVGEAVIRDLHSKFLASGRLQPVTPTQRATPAVERYVHDAGLPPAWIVDMDGTLALGRFGEPGRRGPFDWHRVGEDALHWPVAELVEALAKNGQRIIVMSGRDSVCREATEKWLFRMGVTWHELYMRAEGDQRQDAVVKAELFDRHVRGAWDVRGVLDDRDTVVAFWRSIGLLCAQVAPGDF